MSIQTERFGEIADAIRSYTGETGGIAPNSFAEKIGDVFRAGQESASLEYKLVRTYKPYNENTVTTRIPNVIPRDIIDQYTEFIVLYTIGFAEAHSGLAQRFYAREGDSGRSSGMAIPNDNYTANVTRRSSMQFTKIPYGGGIAFKFMSQNTKPNYTTDNVCTSYAGGICAPSPATFNQFTFEITTPASGTTYTYLADTQFEIYAR